MDHATSINCAVRQLRRPSNSNGPGDVMAVLAVDTNLTRRHMSELLARTGIRVGELPRVSSVTFATLTTATSTAKEVSLLQVPELVSPSHGNRVLGVSFAYRNHEGKDELDSHTENVTPSRCTVARRASRRFVFEPVIGPRPILTSDVGRERATGIEPAFSAWEADVLPLNYARERPPHYPLPRI
jgi:hypothetical protein